MPRTRRPRHDHRVDTTVGEQGTSDFGVFRTTHFGLDSPSGRGVNRSYALRQRKADTPLVTLGPDEVLRAQDVHKFFGTFEVLRGISCAVKRGEVVVIIGPRGAPAVLAGPAEPRYGSGGGRRGGPASREAGDVDRETCLGSPTFRLRGWIPRMSAACGQLIAPLSARRMTSCMRIARSTAARARTMGTSFGYPWLYRGSPGKRTLHVLSGADR